MAIPSLPTVFADCLEYRESLAALGNVAQHLEAVHLAGIAHEIHDFFAKHPIVDALRPDVPNKDRCVDPRDRLKVVLRMGMRGSDGSLASAYDVQAARALASPITKPGVAGRYHSDCSKEQLAALADLFAPMDTLALFVDINQAAHALEEIADMLLERAPAHHRHLFEAKQPTLLTRGMEPIEIGRAMEFPSMSIAMLEAAAIGRGAAIGTSRTHGWPSKRPQSL